MTFDPKTDKAAGAPRARVKSGYQKLKQRGEDDLAAEVRNADTLKEAELVIQNVPDFDPKHDDPNNASRAKVKNIYDSLLELGHDEKATDLRSVEDLGQQDSCASELAREVDGIDPLTGQLDPDAKTTSGGQSDG
jgi:hypothetical protein